MRSDEEIKFTSAEFCAQNKATSIEMGSISRSVDHVCARFRRSRFIGFSAFQGLFGNCSSTTTTTTMTSEIAQLRTGLLAAERAFTAASVIKVTPWPLTRAVITEISAPDAIFNRVINARGMSCQLGFRASSERGSRCSREKWLVPVTR